MLFGIWPTCARKDCGAPALVKFEFNQGGEIFEAWLCIACMGDAPGLFAAASEVRSEGQALPGGLGEIAPIEEDHGIRTD